MSRRPAPTGRDGAWASGRPASGSQASRGTGPAALRHLPPFPRTGPARQKDLEQPSDAAHGNPAWPLAGKHQPPHRSRGTLEKRQVSQGTHNPGDRLPSDRRILSGQGTGPVDGTKTAGPHRTRAAAVHSQAGSAGRSAR